MAIDLQAIRDRLGAEKGTCGTWHDYLSWLIEHNSYFDSKGTFQTQRQVQVQLDEVYVSLRAQREEASGMVDRRLSQEREDTARELIVSMLFSVAAQNSLLERIVEQDDLLSDTELSAEEIEDRLEQLHISDECSLAALRHGAYGARCLPC